MKKLLVAILAMALMLSSFGVAMAEELPEETGLLDLAIEDNDEEELDLDFNPATTEYALQVDFDMDSIDIMAEIATDSAIEVVLNEDTLAEEEATTEGTLDVVVTGAALELGVNVLELFVLNDEDEETVYTVTIHRNLGILTGLAAGTGVLEDEDEEDDDFGLLDELDLDPEFDTAIYDYGLPVFWDAEDEFMLRLELEDEEDWDVVIEYEGDEVDLDFEELTTSTGALFTEMIEPELGTSFLTIEISEDTTDAAVAAVYTVVVRRGILLDDLAVTPGAIDFEPDDFNYYAGLVDYEEDSVDVTVEGDDVHAVLAVNGEEVEDGDTEEVELDVGNNHIIVTSTVEDEDGDVVAEYDVRIRRDNEQGQEPDDPEDPEEPGRPNLPPIPEHVRERFRIRVDWDEDDIGTRTGNSYEFRKEEMQEFYGHFRNGSNLNKAITLEGDDEGTITLDYEVYKFLAQHKVKFVFEHGGDDYMIPLFKLEGMPKVQGPFAITEVTIEFEVDDGEFEEFEVTVETAARGGVQGKAKGKPFME